MFSSIVSLLGRGEAAYRRFRAWSHESLAAKIIKFGSVAAVVINAIFGLAEKREEVFRWMGWDKCHMFNPATGKPSHGLPDRPCLSGRITFVKWQYPFHDVPGDIVDRPNRVLQVVTADGTQIGWGEQKLLRVEGDKEVWESRPQKFWMAMQGGEPVPTWQALNRSVYDFPDQSSGFILRRIDITADSCIAETPANLRTAGTDMLEFFIDNDSGKILDRRDKAFIYMRQITYFCDQDLSSSFRLGQDFKRTGFKLVSVAADP